MTIILKALGMSLGWGVQFQQPIFLIGLILLLTFFAAALWDMIHLVLPPIITDKLIASSHSRFVRDFMAGALATLLATPCTAPFLGTAVGFAITTGWVEIVLIFMTLGLGMTMPYWLVVIQPALAAKLPKPGAWMVYLKHGLGWALAATAVWLVWVLTAQITAPYAALVGLCAAGMLGLMAAHRLRVIKPVIPYGVTLLASLAIAVVIQGAHLPKPVGQNTTQWMKFDEHVLSVDIAEGKTVFVDITADWCLTCKANKNIMLSAPELRDRLFKGDIIAMQGDWTNPDPVIEAFLHKFGRYGIPFNAVFGPGAPQGLVLPELLSPGRVNAALDEAQHTTTP